VSKLGNSGGFMKQNIANKEYELSTEVVLLDDLDNKSIGAINQLHEERMALAKRKAYENSDNRFSLSVKSIDRDEDILSNDEISAEKLVSHRQRVIVNLKNQVIFGHEQVQKSILLKEKTIEVWRVNKELKESERFILQCRYSSKVNMDEPASRAEVIRRLHDDFKEPIENIQKILTNSKGKSKSFSQTKIELDVGRIFWKYSGYRDDISGFELDKRCFSDIKFLCGKKEISDKMKHSEIEEEKYLKMAIFNHNDKEAPRLQTSVDKVFKFKDSKKEFFNNGLKAAAELMKTLHPEEDIKVHPHYDLKAAAIKLEKRENIYLIKNQIKNNPKNNPVLNFVKDIIFSICSMNREAEREVVKFIYDNFPETFNAVSGNGRRSSKVQEA
jgi:hypothetical protein